MQLFSVCSSVAPVEIQVEQKSTHTFKSPFGLVAVSFSRFHFHFHSPHPYPVPCPSPRPLARGKAICPGLCWGGGGFSGALGWKHIWNTAADFEPVSWVAAESWRAEQKTKHILFKVTGKAAREQCNGT